MRKIIVILFFLVNYKIFSQVSISPISMTENGKLYANYGGKAIGMGGTGVANIDKNIINFLNPATYSTIDSLLFIFNAGVFATFVKYYSDKNSGFSSNICINNVSFAFKISNNIGLAFGILPYNYVGYNLNSKIYQQGFLKQLDKNYKGEGGLYNFFAGISFRVRKNFFGGFDICYLNGNVMREEIVSEPEFLKMYYSASKIIYYSGFFISPGIIYNPSFNKRLFFGFKYTPSISLNGIVDYFLSMNDYDTLTYNKRKIKNKIVDKLSLGISYKGEKINFVSDIVKYDLKQFNKQLKFAVGSEYKIKSSRSNKDISLLSGFAYEILPDKFFDKNIYNYNFTIGLCLPVNKNSIIVSFETGKYGLQYSTSLKEYYCTMKVFLTLCEKWFERRKYY